MRQFALRLRGPSPLKNPVRIKGKFEKSCRKLLDVRRVDDLVDDDSEFQNDFNQAIYLSSIEAGTPMPTHPPMDDVMEVLSSQEITEMDSAD